MLNDRLKEARLKAGFTQKQAAEKVGIAATTLSGYERGASDPDVNTLYALMNALGVDANFLYQDYNQEETKKSPAPEGTEDSDKIKRERSYRLFDALVSAGLIRNDDLVADDINFLFHVLDVIDDWFARKERQ